ncbi:MAG: gliding motility-associated C-terminal domain-containing protein, partial [Pedobacter sp.]|nr:gliding motility-associated C-terminal domain-containing protein [Pedobacter sp.]
LPDGLSGVYNPATMEFTITGSSVQSGVFSYIVSTQGGCAIANLNGVIKVTPNSTIILSSDNGTDNQKVCVNTAIKQISYQTANASGAIVTGLPEGLTSLYKDGLFTINGMPKVSGTFSYTVTTIAACQTASMQGTLVVHPNPIGFNDIVSNLTCANNTLNYQLQNNVNTISKGGNAVAASFSWTVAANQNVLGINSGSGNAITASLVNTSHVVQQVIYTVTPVSLLGDCPGTPFTVTVAVPVCSGLTLTKTADVNTVSQAGDLIKYTITVKNTASANHTGVTVTDPFLGGVLARPASGDNGNNILEANESWIYTGTYSVKQTDIDDNGKPTAATGNIINTATVITAEHSGILSASATVNIVTTGAVTLVKTGIMSRDFSTIVYTFKIKNTGKVKLAELDLKDIKIPGEISLSKNTIAVGETINGTATYMVTDQEKRDGRVVNTATVTGKTPAGDLVADVSGTQENNDTPTEFIIDDVPQAVNDRAETIINQPTTFIVTENDMPSFNGLDKGSIIITRAPSNGQLIAHPDGTVTYTPNKGFSGQDDFMYTITDLKGKVSNKALVNITVTPIPVFIPNTFTPNGDGKNDTFKIIGRESFDTTDVLIFNRWGNEVYRNKNYNDEWDGSGLSEGTYYYLIILKKGDNQVSKKGWILIKR